ncbi:MAG: transporter [Vicingaceae bacterium]|nr:transporter [Vicingaceae bacterium]
MKLSFISFLLLITLVFNVKAQSPWTKEKGKAYIQLGASGIFFNKARINGDKVTLGEDFSDITIQAYTEYGITNKLEAQAVLPYKFLYSKNKASSATNNYNNLGNITLGLKYLLSNKKWKLSAGVQYSPKTSSYDNNSGFSTGFNAHTVLPYITIGSSKGKWYYFGNIGYGYLNNNYSDYLRLVLEAGYKFSEKGHVIFAVDTRNIINKEAAFLSDNKQSIFYLDQQNYYGVGLKVNYEFKKDKFGINSSVFGGIDNDNVALAPSFNFGVYVKL